MAHQMVRYQPYSDSDQHYEPLLAFAREYAPLLSPGFTAPLEQSGQWTKESEWASIESGWQYGTSRGFKVVFHEELEPRADGIAVSGVTVSAFGIKKNCALSIECKRYWYDPRYLLLEVDGPENEIAQIAGAFRERFGGEQLLDEVHLQREATSAIVSLKVGAWPAAEMQARAVLKQQPDNIDALFALGVALAAQNKEYEQAEEYLKKLLVLDPTRYDGWYNLGNLYLEHGQYKRAVKQFRKALELSPGNHPALFRIAVALEKMGDTDGAIEAYENAIKTSPNPGQVWHFTGMDFEVRAKEALQRLKGGKA
ncbi:MAG: tetratricopeptide repeat protein [Chloroflexota bacterium]